MRGPEPTGRRRNLPALATLARVLSTDLRRLGTPLITRLRRPSVPSSRATTRYSSLRLLPCVGADVAAPRTRRVGCRSHQRYRRTLPAPPGGSLPPISGVFSTNPTGRDGAGHAPWTRRPHRNRIARKLASVTSPRRAEPDRDDFAGPYPLRGSLPWKSSGSAGGVPVTPVKRVERRAALSRVTIRKRIDRLRDRARPTTHTPVAPARSVTRPYPPDSSAFVHPRTAPDLGRHYPPPAGPFSRHRPCVAGSRCESNGFDGFAVPARRRPGHAPGTVPAVGTDRRNQRSHSNFFALKRPPFRAGPTRPPSARPGTRRRSRQSHSREHRRSDNLRALTRAILPDPTRASRGSLPIESPVSALLAVSEGTLKSKPTPPLVGCRLHALGSHLPVGTAASPRRSWPIPAGPYPLRGSLPIGIDHVGGGPDSSLPAYGDERVLDITGPYPLESGRFSRVPSGDIGALAGQGAQSLPTSGGV